MLDLIEQVHNLPNSDHLGSFLESNQDQIDDIINLIIEEESLFSKLFPSMDNLFRLRIFDKTHKHMKAILSRCNLNQFYNLINNDKEGIYRLYFGNFEELLTVINSSIKSGGKCILELKNSALLKDKSLDSQLLLTLLKDKIESKHLDIETKFYLTNVYRFIDSETRIPSLSQLCIRHIQFNKDFSKEKIKDTLPEDLNEAIFYLPTS